MSSNNGALSARSMDPKPVKSAHSHQAWIKDWKESPRGYFVKRVRFSSVEAILPPV